MSFEKNPIKRIQQLEDKYVRTTRFVALAGPETSGTITLPPYSEVVLDDFGGTTDAILSGLTGGKPDYSLVKDANGVVLATTFDGSGNYVLSGTPGSFPISLLYKVRQKFKNFDSISPDIISAVRENGWGDIGGDIRNQSDLIAELFKKQDRTYRSTFYFSDKDAPISIGSKLYNGLFRSPPLDPESNDRTPVIALANTDYRVDQSDIFDPFPENFEGYCTQVGDPNARVIPSGNIVWNVWLRETLSGAWTTKAALIIRTVSATGVETEHLRIESPRLTNVTTKYIITGQIPLDISIDETDRVVFDVVFFCDTAGTGTQGVFTHSGNTRYSNVDTPILPLPSAGIIRVSYATLKMLADANQLVAGSTYVITDFVTKYVQPLSEKLKVGPYDFDTITPTELEGITEKIVVQAVSNTVVSQTALSETYGDELTYDFGNTQCIPDSKLPTWNALNNYYLGSYVLKNGNVYTPLKQGVMGDPEVDVDKFKLVCAYTDLTRKGCITRRTIPSRSISMPCDFRTMKWARCNPSYKFWDGGVEQDIPDYAGSATEGLIYKEGGVIWIACKDVSPATISEDPVANRFIPVVGNNYQMGCIMEPRWLGIVNYQLLYNLEDYQEFWTFHDLGSGNSALTTHDVNHLGTTVFGDLADTNEGVSVGQFNTVMKFYDANSSLTGNIIGQNAHSNTLYDGFRDNRIINFFKNTLSGPFSTNVQIGLGQLKGWMLYKPFGSVQNNVVYDNVHDLLLGWNDVIRSIFHNQNGNIIFGQYENNDCGYECMDNVWGPITVGNTIGRGWTNNLVMCDDFTDNFFGPASDHNRFTGQSVFLNYLIANFNNNNIYSSFSKIIGESNVNHNDLFGEMWYSNLGQNFNANTVIANAKMQYCFFGKGVESCTFGKDGEEINYAVFPAAMTSQIIERATNCYVPSPGSVARGTDNAIIGGFSTIDGIGSNGIGQGFAIRGSRSFVVGRNTLNGSERGSLGSMVVGWASPADNREIHDLFNYETQNWLDTDLDGALDGPRTTVTLKPNYSEDFRINDYIRFFIDGVLDHTAKVISVNPSAEEVTFDVAVPAFVTSGAGAYVYFIPMPVAIYASEGDIPDNNAVPIRWLDPFSFKWNEENKFVNGIILKSPDDTLWQVTIDNAGVLQTTPI